MKHSVIGNKRNLLSVSRYQTGLLAQTVLLYTKKKENINLLYGFQVENGGSLVQPGKLIPEYDGAPLFTTRTISVYGLDWIFCNCTNQANIHQYKK